MNAADLGSGSALNARTGYSPLSYSISTKDDSFTLNAASRRRIISTANAAGAGKNSGTKTALPCAVTAGQNS